MEICYMSGTYSATPLPFRFRCPPQTFIFRKNNETPKNSPSLLPCIARNLQSESAEGRSGTTSRMFMLGMGFVGQFFADQLKKDGWEVFGTCKSAVKKKKLEGMGFDVYLFNTNDEEQRSLGTLEYATHMLVSIPPVVGIGDPVLYRHRHLLQNILSRGNLRWLCYLSSTSVYGDWGGAWVDEDYPTNPTSESAKARLAAEEGWLGLGHYLGISVQVLRLGGIYGPGRSALDTIIKQESLSEGQRMRETKQYTSRVHVADICQALKASIDMPSSGKIYNVVDDDPAPRGEVFAFARALVEKRWPSQIKQRPLPDDPDSNFKGEKRVCNARLKNELGVRLLHPTYRSGLQSIIDYIDYPSFQ